MLARPVNQTAWRRSAPLEVVEIAEAPGPRPAAILAVLALVVTLMSAPMLIAMISILDADLLAGARSWMHGASMWLSYLAHVQFLGLPLALVVARSPEDS